MGLGVDVVVWLLLLPVLGEDLLGGEVVLDPAGGEEVPPGRGRVRVDRLKLGLGRITFLSTLNVHQLHWD